MTEEELKDLCLCGETTKVQFKETFTSQKEIAKEMIAFANTKGGVILFGVEDKSGKLVGLSYDEIQTISRELGNAANEQVRPTIYIETDVVRVEGKHFLVCTVEEGKNKPYKNLNGEIWVKQGADKRRITENSEILALFQDSGSYQPDAAGVNGRLSSKSLCHNVGRFWKQSRAGVEEHSCVKPQWSSYSCWLPVLWQTSRKQLSNLYGKSRIVFRQ